MNSKIDNKPLLSVIIPCYNVERYVDKCISSVISQTYDNIEIILINDGSLDNTPLLCEQWKGKDDRVLVIHQENRGLPATRAVGVNNARGEFITFVDSDDSIHPLMYEYMINGLLKEGVEIAICGVCDTFDEGRILKNRKTNIISPEYNLYSSLDGVIRILDDKEWNSYMWNKVYHRSLFDGIIFPIGRQLDEDLSIQHILFHKSNGIVRYESEFYYYLHRENSICHSVDRFSVAKKIFDRNSARWERFLFVFENPEYHAMLLKMKNIYVSVAITGLRKVCKYPEYFPDNYYDTVVSNICKISLRTEEMHKSYFSSLKRIEYMMIRYIPQLYRLCFSLLSS